MTVILMIVDLDVIQADLFIVKITRGILFLIVDVDEVNQVQIDGYPKVLVLHRLLQHHQLQPLHHSEVKTVRVMDHDSGISVVRAFHAVTLLKAVISENEGIQDAVVGILAVRPHEELQVIHGNRHRRQHRHRHQLLNQHQLQILLHQAVNRMEVSVVYQISAVVRTVEVVEQQRVGIVAEPILILVAMYANLREIRTTHQGHAEMTVQVLLEYLVQRKDQLSVPPK